MLQVEIDLLSNFWSTCMVHCFHQTFALEQSHLYTLILLVCGAADTFALLMMSGYRIQTKNTVLAKLLQFYICGQTNLPFHTLAH